MVGGKKKKTGVWYRKEDRRQCLTSNQTSNQILDDVLVWVVWRDQEVSRRKGDDGEVRCRWLWWWSIRWRISKSQIIVRGNFKNRIRNGQCDGVISSMRCF